MLEIQDGRLANGNGRAIEEIPEALLGRPANRGSRPERYDSAHVGAFSGRGSEPQRDLFASVFQLVRFHSRLGGTEFDKREDRINDKGRTKGTLEPGTHLAGEPKRCHDLFLERPGKEELYPRS